MTHWYNDPESWELREAVGAREQVPPETVVVGPGIDGLLSLICRVVLDPGSSVVTTKGSYPTFTYAARGVGAVVHEVPYSAEKVDLGGLAEAARNYGARLVYVANPDNPSGSWQCAEELAKLRAELPSDTLLVLDEAYREYAPGPGTRTPLASTIRLRTFSKAHGMAGARIGYALAEPWFSVQADKIRMHFEVNSIAQAGALASVEDPEWVKSVASRTAEGVKVVHGLCESLGLGSLDTHTNFVLVDLGSPARANRMLREMLELGVFLRKPGLPPLDRYVRVTVGLPDQMSEFGDILRRWIESGARE